MLSSDTTLYLEYLLYSNRKITGGQMNRRSWIYYRLSTASLVATTLLGLAIWLVGAVTEDSVGEIIYMVMILVSMFLMLVNIYLTRTK